MPDTFLSEPGERFGTLYVVSTPIGNPDDLSPRARDVLSRVDVLAAEDTRVARTLLGRLGLRRSSLSYHEHNEEQRTRQLLAKLREGRDVALISDAGTPLVSDPGFRLIREAAEQGVPVVPVPGPCAALAALVVSGLPTDRFVVLGFLPRRPAKRRAALEELRHLPMTLVLYEAPHRIVATLEDLAEILGDRRAALARSLTKENESVVRDGLVALHRRCAAEERVYGEITLVIEGAEEENRLGESAERAIDRLLDAGLPPKQVRDLVSDIFRLPKRDVYQRLVDRRTAEREA